MPANDDLSTGAVPIGFTVDYFGLVFTTLYVNNNGNITFDVPLGTFTPFDLTSTATQIIAPFFADVDTRAGNVVTYGNDTVGGRPAFGVNWIGVGYFSFSTDKLNSFQLILIDRSDIAAGDFDFEFNYDQIQWETGSASGGSGGLGGNSARAGFSNGTGNPGTFFEIPGSAINGAFLDSNLATGLIYNSLNSDVPGRYLFRVRGGIVEPPSPCGCMDVALVIDDTGSMGGALNNVKAELPAIITAANSASGGDLRMGVVTFKDNVKVDQPFTTSTNDVKAAINAIVASGGGGEPESSDEALNYTVTGATPCALSEPLGPLGAFRAECVKIAVLITDARPGGCDSIFVAGVDDVNAHNVALSAAASNILVSAVYVPTFSVSATIQAIMQDYATTTGGAFVQTASDGTGSGAAIQAIIESCGGAGQGTLDVIKFYDANANGINDDAQDIANWPVRIQNTIDVIALTPVNLPVNPDDYTVSEFLPSQLNWLPTTATSVVVSVTAGATTSVEFGNLCLGAGGGRTLGFWSNKNGLGLLSAADFTALNALCLRNANGSDRDFLSSLNNNKKDLNQWLLDANANNMANMLSAQLAAMTLNVRKGFVDGNRLVYAPGCGNTGVGNNFITVNDLMAAANTSLCAFPVTRDGHAQRGRQECLKTALDKANNNRNFVQLAPCPFSFNGTP